MRRRCCFGFHREHSRCPPTTTALLLRHPTMLCCNFRPLNLAVIFLTMNRYLHGRWNVLEVTAAANVATRGDLECTRCDEKRSLVRAAPPSVSCHRNQPLYRPADAACPFRGHHWCLLNTVFGPRGRAHCEHRSSPRPCTRPFGTIAGRSRTLRRLSNAASNPESEFAFLIDEEPVTGFFSASHLVRMP